MREIEDQPGKEAMRPHSEKQACPRRRSSKAAEAVLSRGQSERGGKAFWDAEQFDHHPARCWGACIASEALLPAETIMRPLRTGQKCRRENWADRTARLYLHLQALVSQQVQARPPMKPPAPVPPEQRSSPDDEGM